MISSTNLIPANLKKALDKRWYVGLFRIMEGYRLLYLTATLFQGVGALSRTGIYLLFAYLIDTVLPGDNFLQEVPWIAAGFLGLAILGGTFTFLSGSFAARSAESIARNVRNYIYDHIQRLPFLYHDKTSTGELIQRSTSDIDTLRRFFSEQALGMGRIILLFLVNMIALLIMNWQLALMSTVIVPVTIAIGYFFFKKISDAYEKFQEQDAVVSSVLQENLSGVRVVKAFARQKYETNKFDKENWEKYERGKHLLTMHSLYWPISDIITSAQMLFGFYMAATFAINGDISLGTYLAYHGMIIWVLWPIRNLGRLIVQMSTGLVSYKRIMEMVKETKEPVDQGDYRPDGKPEGAIKFSGLNFSYEGAEEQVLKNISFECKPGSVVALLGSTGSGKTSLVNLLPRFYEYKDGSITLDGVELNRYPRTYLRSQIGIVEQEPFLFSRTIRENISYGLGQDVSKEEIEQAAKAAAIHDVIMEFPEAYETLVGEKGVTLSGGQKQRVAIARTLLKNPKILILDDATSSVDTETEAAIRSALDGLMENRTTFIIAHRIQSVMNADLILVFDKGEIVQKGSHDELVKTEGIYRDVFDIQTQIEDELAERSQQPEAPLTGNTMSNYFEEEEFTAQHTGKTLRRILTLVKPYFFWVMGFVLTISIVSGLDSYFTYLSKRIVDEGIGERDLEKLIEIITQYGLLAIIQAAAVFGFIYLAGVLGERIRYDLREKMFKHLQTLSLSYFNKTPVGWIMSRVTSDSDRVAELVTWGLLDVTWGIMNIVTALYFMFTINWRIALIVLAIIPVLVLVATEFRKRIIKQFRLVRKINSKITGAYNENITGVRVIKALRREKGNLKEFGGLTSEMYNAGYRAAWLSALFLPTVQILSSLALGAVIWIGGIQVDLGLITIGGIQAFISYINFMMWPIQDLARVYAEMQQSIASAERIFSLLDAKPGIENLPAAYDPGTIKGNIEFQDVNFAYEEDDPVLKNFTLSVEQGETIALVGPTGGGKTTIVNLLGRFFEPTTGQIMIDGKNYQEYTQESIQSRIGIVLQTPHLFSGNVMENIRYGRLDASDDEVIEASKLAGAHSFIENLEKDYNEDVGEGGNLLSVGQKQLISLARAILADPEIFIMDEATSSVDTLTEALIQKGMELMMEGRTSFVIAHRLSTIKRADRILVIEDGQIAELGSHQELLKKQGHYYRLYTQQFRRERSEKLDPFLVSQPTTD